MRHVEWVLVGWFLGGFYWHSVANWGLTKLRQRRERKRAFVRSFMTTECSRTLPHICQINSACNGLPRDGWYE